MRQLLHLWLSPFSRKVRVALAEKGVDFTLQVERVWERRPEFLAQNPAGLVPVLVEEDGSVIAESSAICEYLEDVFPEPSLLGTGALARAEVRRLVAWFDLKFNAEVTRNLVNEKVMKRFLGLGEPDTSAIRAGRHNIGYHLDFIAYLTERRKWLAGDDLSLADIAAGAHISCLDYLSEVPWEDYPLAKDWYVRIKSRPSFRPLLGDRVAGLEPPKHYADLDF